MKPARILASDGAVDIYERFFDNGSAANLFSRIWRETEWERRELRMMGRTIPMPRLIAYFGTAPYNYSGQVHPPAVMPEAVLACLEPVEKILGHSFNAVLINAYRDGADSMSWHADDEPELGNEPVIASLSLGATRRFLLRRRDRSQRFGLNLATGDLLVMSGPLQRHWQHALPKTRKPVGPRINLTFRHIYERKVT